MVTISPTKNNKFASFAKSLRFRLIIILIAVGAVPIFILKFGILSGYETQTISQREKLILGRGEMIAKDLLSSGYLQGKQSDEVEKEVERLRSIWGGRILVLDSTFQVIRDTSDRDVGRFIMDDRVLRCFNGEEIRRSYNRGAQKMDLVVPIDDADTNTVHGVMLISVPTTDIENGKAELSATVYLMEGLLVLFVCFAAFYASGILVRPFKEVTASLRGKGSSPDEEISIPDYTETQLLAEAYNEMRQRMEAQEASRQEFVSNVSHELKTPLTSMKVLADSLISQEEVPNELYREFMTDMSEEIDRENKIISDLLTLVKMDRKSSDVNIKETNINDLIDLILKRLRPIAALKNVELVLENYKPILAEVDETKLTLAISNLVENAIKYNKPEGGWVHVSLNVDMNFCYVKVEDSGIGIPEDQQAFIFERFYRVDKSHSREIGGTGLGLAITRSVVRMHHGALRVYSKEGEGTTFTMRIPLHYAQVADREEQHERTDAQPQRKRRRKKREGERNEKKGKA